MTTYSLTLRDEHLAQLKDHLLRVDGREHAAYILCNRAVVRHEPWGRHAHQKFLVVRVIPVPDDQVIESTPHLVTWSTVSYVHTLKEAAANNQVIGIVHNHPSAMPWFSEQDNQNEPDLIQMAVNRNGGSTNLISLILTTDGQLIGRVWLKPKKNSYERLDMIRTIGIDYQFHYPNRDQGVSIPALHRQALAFGDALNSDFQKMRIGIVGCGGTGSALAMLLARLGAGQLLLIDNDIVDRTNLNRLHGARQADADAMRPKAKVVARTISEMGLGIRAIPIEAWVADPECRDPLRSCDVIFGCTDDHEGRLFLNRFAYYYITPVIDIGLAIELNNGSPPSFTALDGRVTVLGPRHTCLLCRSVIDSEIARTEAMRRSDPDEYEQRKAEAYVIGEANPNPAVITFTTELACMAVNELIHRLQGFRGLDGAIANRVRKFHLGEDRRPGHKPHTACPICANETVWGRGDTEPFLGRID